MEIAQLLSWIYRISKRALLYKAVSGKTGHCFNSAVLAVYKCNRIKFGIGRNHGSLEYVSS